MRKLVGAALLLGMVSGTAQAHEVWVERDGSGPARIYLGEPAQRLPEGGDPEFGNLKSPRIVPASTAPQRRKAGYIEVAVPAGDVRVTDDTVFAPWGKDGAREAVIYYARAGRSEAGTVLPYEIAPLAAGGDRFALVAGGKPVSGASITVIAPDKTTETLTAGADGAVQVMRKTPGRYILTATQVDTGKLRVVAGPVAKLHHIATTSFVIAPPFAS